VQYQYITTDQQLQDLCNELRQAKVIAFDTEFVSEDSYLPELCLIQVAAGEQIALIDPLAIDDVTPFWKTLAEPGHKTIVHAGREELRFSLFAIEQAPHALYDVQIAGGIVGLEYPASYGTLVHKLLGKNLAKGETRSDWRRRPLSTRQLDYAVQDVADLQQVATALQERTATLGRTEWCETEVAEWQNKLQRETGPEAWRNVSGSGSLNRQNLAIVRELWYWRDGEAKSRNRPARRILRDDLICELARQQTADPQRIRAIRGMNRSNLNNRIPELAAAVQTALDLDASEHPTVIRKNRGPHLTVLTQFLSTALGNHCKSAEIAPNMVATTQDVRDWLAYRFNRNNEQAKPPPTLAAGWRASLLGSLMEDLLAGKVALRVADPWNQQPLTMVRLNDEPSD
jgi:ribonuclease D